MHQNNRNTFKGFRTSGWHCFFITECLIFKNCKQPYHLNLNTKI